MSVLRYDEITINKMLAVMEKITVTGCRQAEYLLMLRQFLAEGKQEDAEKVEAVEGGISNGSKKGVI